MRMMLVTMMRMTRLLLWRKSWMSGLPENRQLYEAVETTDWCAQPYSEYREGCKYTKTQLHKLIQIQRHNIRIQIHYTNMYI